jgi:hypothetical protein
MACSILSSPDGGFRFAENGTVHDAEAPEGAASPSRWMQADAAEPDIGSERDITRLGESVVKVGTWWQGGTWNGVCTVPLLEGR